MKMMKWGLVGFGLFILLRYPVWATVDNVDVFANPVTSTDQKGNVTVLMPGGKVTVNVQKDGTVVIKEAKNVCIEESCKTMAELQKAFNSKAFKDMMEKPVPDPSDNEGSGMVGISEGGAGCSKNGTCGKYIDPDVARAEGKKRMEAEAKAAEEGAGSADVQTMRGVSGALSGEAWQKMESAPVPTPPGDYIQDPPRSNDVPKSRGMDD